VSCRIFALRPALNAGRPWSDQEDSDLLDYDAQSYPTESAAVFLGRESKECAQRLEILKRKAR
jgi:hypothetical protein